MHRRTLLKWTGLIAGTSLTGQLKYHHEWDKYYNHQERKLTDPARLCYNENPFGPSKRVRSAMKAAFDEAYKYPTAGINDLAEKIAQLHGVSFDHVVVTGGSREGLKAAGVTYASNGKEVLTCAPTYRALIDYAVRFDGVINSLPLREDLNFDLDAMRANISDKTGLVFLCNPNNPTGTLLSGAESLKFCDEVSNKVMVFADEVYYDYVDEPNYPTMVELVKKGKDVIVARTFSKIYGLAGARVGYLIARPDIAKKLKNNLQASSNIIAVRGAMEAMDEKSFFDMSLKKNREAREYVYDLCESLSLPYQKSHTNFVFFKTGRPIQSFIEDMRKQNVLVGRPFPPLLDWCRISTGKMNEMESFGKALKKVM